MKEKQQQSDFKYILAFIGIALLLFTILTTVIAFSYIKLKNTIIKNIEENARYEKELQIQNERIKTDTRPVNKNVKDINNTSIPVKVKTVTNTTTKQTQSCRKYALAEPFNSNKCYTYNDYSKLYNAYMNYNTANSNIKFYKNGIEQFCDGTDFFKDTCKTYKKTLKYHEEKKNTYEQEILTIMERGM